MHRATEYPKNLPRTIDIDKISLILSSSLNVCDFQQYFDQAVFSGIFPSVLSGVLSGVWMLFDLYYKVVICLAIRY